MTEVGEALLRVIADEMIRAWTVCRLMLGRSLAYCSVNYLHPNFGRVGTGDPRVQGLMDADRIQAILADMPADERAVFEAHQLSDEKRPWESLDLSRSTYFRRLDAARTYIRNHLDS